MADPSAARRSRAIGGERPAIVVVGGDGAGRAAVHAELTSRYADTYDIVACADGDEGRAALGALRRAGAGVALVLVSSPEIEDAVTLLGEVEATDPAARRALLVQFGAWGDAVVASEIRRAIASGRADYYVLRPWRRGDELFHRSISEFLYEYSRTNPRAEPRQFAVIADRWSRRGHELRQLLARNGIPHVFYEAGSPDAVELLARHDAGDASGALVVTARGEVLQEPDDAELARHYGVNTVLDAGREFDVIVVGAGPAGLAVAISAAADGLSVLVVEREGIGGQASTSSRIRNYLGFSRGVSGAELAQRAYQQAWAFGVEFLHMCAVTGIRGDRGRYVLELASSPDVAAPAIVLAMGVRYRRLDVAAIEELLGRGVYYGASVSEAGSLVGADVVVVGGGNSAGQAALHLARSAGSVTIVTLEAMLDTAMSSYLREEIAGVANISVRPSCTVVDGGGVDHLEWILLRDADGSTERVGADAVFLFIGAVPHTDWLPASVERDAAGFVLTGQDVAGAGPDRIPSLFETSAPGVFAVGDVRAGSVKRVASAVGEGSVVVPHVIAHVARASSAAPRS